MPQDNNRPTLKAIIDSPEVAAEFYAKLLEEERKQTPQQFTGYSE